MNRTEKGSVSRCTRSSTAKALTPAKECVLEQEINGRASPNVEYRDGSENSNTKNHSSCQCQCQQRLVLLEDELKDLKSWKAGRQQLDDLISRWKQEVEDWIQSTFGYSITESLSTPKGTGDDDECQNNLNNSDSKDVISEQTVEENLELLKNLNSDDAENVEITPDLFGHFLLDNEYDHGESESDLDDIEDIDESLGDEEELESEVPNDKEFRRPRRRRDDDDSDSECYTLSSSSEDVSTSEDDYEPQRKRGRGRARGFPSSSSLSPNKSAVQTGKSSSIILKKASTGNNAAEIGNAGSSKELLQYCRKRQGNIWECTVCGFMLTSFENMLLHIKYNHSSSTHTCPYCRIVLLCRSPKDAISHHAQCKMRPPISMNKSKVSEAKIIRPVQIVQKPVITTRSKSSPTDVNAEIDKFVDDILGPAPGPSTKNKITPIKNNTKKTETPAVVTLSSDED